MLEELGLGGQEGLDRLATYLDTDADGAKTAGSAATAALLGGLQKRATAPGGETAAFELAKGSDPAVLDDPLAIAESGSPVAANETGEALVDGILGSRRGRVEQGVAESSGLDVVSVNRLLPAMAPLVMGFLGKKVNSGGGMTASELSGLLGNLKGVIANSPFSGLLNLFDGDDAPGDQAHFIKTVEELVPDADLGSDAAAAAAGSDDSGRRGLAWWIWPAIGLAALIALGLILARCGGDDDTADTSEVVSAEVDASAVQAAVDAAVGEPGVITAEVDADGVVTLTGEVEADTVRLAAGEAAASVPGVTEVQNLVTLTGEAGPDPLAVQAEVDTAVGSSGSVVAEVGDGGAVLLTGSVASEDVKTAAGDAAAGVPGVTTVDNQVAVAGSGSDTTAADATTPDPTSPADEPETLNQQLDLDPVQFESGSARITPEGEAVLDEVVAALLDDPRPVRIEGHTDNVGNPEDNQELSEDRASSVEAYLVENGVPEDDLTSVGFGEEQPIASNDTAEGRAANRRIDFVLIAP